MNFLYSIYFEGLFRPLFNILVGLYDLIPNIGAVIIIITLIIRLILFPLYQKQISSQKALQNITPELNEIKEKFKDNKEAQSQALLDFYKKKKINPLSSCLPLVIQFPILIALYRVFISGLENPDFGILYSFIPQPESISPIFFANINLADSGNWILAILAGAAQLWQTRMLMNKRKKTEVNKNAVDKPTKEKTTEELTQSMTSNFTYILPLITVWFAYRFPAGLALYWLITTLFAIGQQYFILKGNKVKTNE